MKLDHRYLRTLAAFAFGLFVLVACQLSTGPAANTDDPVVATVEFPVNASRAPDSTAWKTKDSSGSRKITCSGVSGATSLTCTDTFRLPSRLGKDSMALELWTLGVRTSTIYLVENGGPTVLTYSSVSRTAGDSLNIKLLASYDSLPKSSRDSINAVGSGPAGLVAYYAKLILAGNPLFSGKPIPTGMSQDAVNTDLVYWFRASGATANILVTLKLDSATVQKAVSALIKAKLLASSDSLALFPPPPVQLKTPIGVGGNLTIGGSAVPVTGAFVWTAGKTVTPRIEFRSSKGLDTNLSYAISSFPLSTETTWKLDNSLTILAKSTADTGIDTLIVTLSVDAAHSVSSSTAFAINVAVQSEAPSFAPSAGAYATAQAVSLTSRATGVTFYYTTDGSSPTAASTKYSGSPIDVSAGETIRAIAVEPGHPASPISSATYVIGTASTPAFSVASGTYSSAQNVSLSSATSGASIYYTTDGTTPTSSSAKYTGAAITVVASETIQAISVQGGMSTSPVASATYAIGSTSAPTFAPIAGTYSSAQKVVLSSTTPGASIYYTTDGSNPTASSTKYPDTAIAVSGSETIKAVAVANGFTSTVVIAVYTISIPGETTSPTFSPVAGTYSMAQNVALSCATAGATIYYTVDGTVPTTSSSVYSAPIAVAASETIKAIAVAAGSNPSTIANAAYTIQTPAATPTFTPAAGTYTSAQTVTLATTTPSATIYYTADGTAPTTSSSVYSGPIAVAASQTIKAIAVAAGYTSSPVGAAAYVIQLPAATPTFSVSGGSYTASQLVTLATTTPSATIYYTVDGTTPTTTSSVYSEPINVSASETIKAIAVATGSSTSTVASATYTITIPGLAAIPTVTPAAGTYPSAQTVTLATTTPSATIYYTVDGTAPTTSSSVYSAPIAVSASETIKAIAVAAGFSPSPIASAAYIIQSPAAAPTFSPAAGTFTSAQTVTLATTTPSAAIYYTVDGTAPTTSSSVYSAPIAVSASETIKAIAVAAGYANSPMASAAYVILPLAATPTITVAGTNSMTVTISSTTSGSTIYYTTNGAVPTTSDPSLANGGSFTLTAAGIFTVRAIAVNSGFTTSAIANSVPITVTLPNVDLTSITVEGTPVTLTGLAGSYTLDLFKTSAVIVATAVDENATISIDGTAAKASPNTSTVSLSSTKVVLIKVTNGAASPKTYTVTLNVPTTGTITTTRWTTNRQSETYTIKKIGSKWWMTQPLDYMAIPYGSVIGQCQDANNDCSASGRSYTWAEATDVGTCPSGWSLPSLSDWQALGNSQTDLGISIGDFWSSTSDAMGITGWTMIGSRGSAPVNRSAEEYLSILCTK
jgi:hypothetical protein